MLKFLKQSRNKSQRRWWLGLAGISLFCLPLGFLLSGSAKPEETASRAIPSVAAAPVRREDLWREQVFDAEFRPYQEIDLHAKVTGFLETIEVDIGDKVKAGQLIASLEIPELTDDLERAKAVEKRSLEEAKRAEIARDEAHLALSRLLRVDQAQPNLVAQAEIDIARSKHQAAEANLAAAKEQVGVVHADVKRLNTMVQYSRIVAPFDGVITKRYLDPGALVQGGTSSTAPLVRLSQIDHLRLGFPASMSFASKILVGTPVEIRVSTSERKYRGTVSRFSRRIDFQTRTMEVEVDVPNSDLELVPGMYAAAVVRVDRKEQALVVPVEAVLGQQSPTVYLIGKDGVVAERKITVGLEMASVWEVTSGLEEADLVLMGSRGQVRPGQKVVPKLTETLHAMK